MFKQQLEEVNLGGSLNGSHLISQANPSLNHHMCEYQEKNSHAKNNTSQIEELETINLSHHI